MPYVTSAERIGIEKGRLEGRDEGMLFEARKMVLKRLLRSAIQSKDIEDFKKGMRVLIEN